MASQKAMTATIQRGTDNMKTRQPGDLVRGVGANHSRMHPATNAEFDRLVHEQGIPCPWHRTAEEQAQPSRYGEFLAFLSDLAHAGTRRREILFHRLLGLSWLEIGAAVLRGATAQAAEKEFAAMLDDMPNLRLAFPERQTRKTP